MKPVDVAEPGMGGPVFHLLLKMGTNKIIDIYIKLKT